jgi:hypothetical protein
MSLQIVVSLNKNSEFAYADSHRRKVIVKQHKDQSSGRYPSIGYREAENFLPVWIDTQLDKTHLAQRFESLNQLKASLQGTNQKSGYMQGINNGINALRWLIELGPISFPEDVSLQCCNQFNSDGLRYGNVLVKARPNGLVIRQRKGVTSVGAIKFHFSKRTPLSDRAGDLAAVGLYEYLKHCSDMTGGVVNSLCYSIDTCRRSVRTAPRSHIKIHNQLVDACEQYELMWNSIK